MALEITFLGTATSVGVPMIGCNCATCTSEDPRDKRSRCSIHVDAGDLRWVVDTGPDFRSQCLREGIVELDAVLYTHAHMDHITGFDELRRFTIPADSSIPIYGMESTLADLERMFTFAFNGENRYPGYLKPDPRPFHSPFSLGSTKVTPLPVVHGKVDTCGYLFESERGKRVVYMPDVKVPKPESLEQMRDVDLLIIDALRFTPHPTHMNFEEALAMVADLRPAQTYFTHFSCEVRHADALKEIPPGVSLAYDGLKIIV